MVTRDAGKIVGNTSIALDADYINKPKRSRDGQTLVRVRSVSRAIAILRCFSIEQPFLSLGEIAKKADISYNEFPPLNHLLLPESPLPSRKPELF